MKVALVLMSLFSAVLGMIFGLIPFHDDWSYFTAPNPDFHWRQLLPAAAFWRPFDVLWGGLMGIYPNAFPLANKVVIALAHTLNTWMVWRVLRRLIVAPDSLENKRCSLYSSFMGAMFFAVSSSVAATLVNTDTINQSWSFFFGITSLFVALKRPAEFRFMVLPLFLAILSILFKESGVSWFAVVSLVLWWRDKRMYNALRYAVCFGILFVLYFGIRFALLGEVVVGDGQYYAIAFNMESILVNLFLSVFAPLSGIDGLAFACEKWAFLIASAVLSLVFWSLFGHAVERKNCARTLWITGAIAVCMSIPHCFFKGHHPAEMHFYPVLFAGAFLLGVLPLKNSSRILKSSLLMVMTALSFVVWYDKLGEIHKRSERTKKLYAELQTKNIDFSKPVYFIVDVDKEVNYYSVFAGSAAHGVEFGKACRSFNGWKEFDWHMAYTPEQIARIPFNAQTIRIK